VGEVALAGRYALGLTRFLSHPLSDIESAELISAERDHARASFLDALARVVFGNAASPYLPLFNLARIAHADVERSVQANGIEATLEWLFEAGVRITLDEFKGSRPIIRPGLELAVRPEAFDNLPGSAGFVGATGGSSAAPRRLTVDLTGLEPEGAYYRLMLQGYGVAGLPTALWRPVPPGVTGVKAILRAAKAGYPVDRWFTPSTFVDGLGGLRGRSMVALTLAAGRRAGVSVPWPRHVPPADPLPVVHWLADTLKRSPGAIMHCTTSSAVRICAAAEAAGLSIAGTFFRLGGEPFTEASRRRLAAAGARGATLYSMSEVGNVGMPCPEAGRADELHVLDGKLAVLGREVTLESGESVTALYLTSLGITTSKFLLNVESGDAGTLERRGCGCPFGRLGLTQRVSGIRSYEKLTCEGMSFMATDLLRLIEEILPARFGGNPTDYQLVRDDTGELERLTIVVAPGVGPVSDPDVLECVLRELAGAGRAETMMAEIWRSAGTLRVRRREPHVTGVGKTPALVAGHVTRM
jgi:hypothetical protein